MEARSKRAKNKATTKDRVLEFLREHQTGVLATASPGAKPHASVVYYSVDAQLNITFITKRRTRKGENLHLNDQAEMVVYDEESQTTVEVSGRAVELTDQTEASLAFRNALKASLGTASNAIPPISKLVAGDYIAYRLSYDQIRMAVFNRRGSQQTNGLFEVINR